MKLETNFVTAIGIIAICVVGTASILSNHDQMELTMTVIALLTGIPHVTDYLSANKQLSQK